MRSRILIHALGVDVGGGLRHLRGFLPALGALDATRDYTVLTRQGLALPQLPPNVRLATAPRFITRSWFARLLYDLLVVPLTLRRGGYAAIVTLTNFGPICAGIPHINFQTNSLYYCPYFLDRIAGVERLEIWGRRLLVLATMKRARVVVTPSRAMADMIRRQFPSLGENRFAVLYHGVPDTRAEEPLDAGIEAVVSRTPRPRLIYAAHLHRAFYKGFAELFDLLACAKRQGQRFSLLLTIDIRDNPGLVATYRSRLEELGIAADVHFLGRVAPGQMAHLYSACAAMVFPSHCESFGFPLLEAISRGLPVLASDTSVHREICGDAAAYFDPTRPQEAADTLAKLLSGGRAANKPGAAARMSSYDWSWSRHAREFVAIVGRFL